MQENQQSVTLRGRLHANSNRCVLIQNASTHGVLLKCPGLGLSLVRDIQGITVRSGSPMVDIPCVVTGYVLDGEVVAPFDFVFGNISQLVVYGDDEQEIIVDLESLTNLSPLDEENYQYFMRLGRPDDASEMRQRLLRARQSW